MSGTMSGYLDPALMLAGGAQGFAQAAMPSRMPVPFGAALGMAAGGMAQGAKDAQAMQLQQQQLQAAKMQNEQMQSLQPYMLAQNKALAQMGVNSPGQQPADGTPAPLISPQMAAIFAQRAAADPKNARGAEPWLHYIEGLGPNGGGSYVGQDGAVHPMPGADPTAAARTTATAGAQAGVDVNKAWSMLAPEAQKALTAAGIDVNKAWQTPQAMTPGSTVASPSQMQQPAAPKWQPVQVDPNDPATQASLKDVPKAYQPMVLASSQKYGVPVPYVVAHMKAENGNFNPIAKSDAGALGLMQVMPASAPGVDLLNPGQNIDAGVGYLRQGLDRFGNLPGATTGYVAGPNSRTANYVASVNDNLKRYGYQQPAAQQPAQGPVTVPIAPKVQEKQADADVTQYADMRKSVLSDAEEAQRTKALVQNTQAAIAAATKGGIPPGAYSKEALEGAAAAQYLGINLKPLGIDPSALAAGQVSREQLQQLNGALLKKMFPQRITNTDLTMVGSALPNYGMDPAAIGANFDIYGKQADYSLNRANDMLAYETAQRKAGAPIPLQGWDAQFYGKNGYSGGPLEGLFKGSAAPSEGAKGAASVSAPSAAVEHLKANPSLRSAFDAKYGAGAAAQVLGGK